MKGNAGGKQSQRLVWSRAKGKLSPKYICRQMAVYCLLKTSDMREGR